MGNFFGFISHNKIQSQPCFCNQALRAESYPQESPDGEQKMLAISHVKTIFRILPSGYG
jgi:hypothetical protein